MIKSEIKNNVGKIYLDRPNKYHSFVREMAFKLQDILKEYKNNDDVRSILITAQGKAFCAGQDLNEAIDPKKPDITQIIEEHYNPIIRTIRSIEKPVIAAVNGVAAGAGASIAIACDIIIASEKASFIQAFGKIGLIPDSGATFILPRLIGMQRATSLMLTGDPVSANDAQKMGMIYKVYESDIFVEESIKLSEKLAKMPTRGLGLTKKALNSSLNNNLEGQLELEKEYQTIAANTNDYKEGVQAFLEKRKPNFKGN